MYSSVVCTTCDVDWTLLSMSTHKGYPKHTSLTKPLDGTERKINYEKSFRIV